MFKNNGKLELLTVVFIQSKENNGFYEFTIFKVFFQIGRQHILLIKTQWEDDYFLLAIGKSYKNRQDNI